MPKLIRTCVVLASLALAGCGSEGDRRSSAADGQGSGASAIEAAAMDREVGLSTASRLLKLAGLDQLLSGPGSYTIFAPSDEVFAALPEDHRKRLESAEGRPQLQALLRQHMVSGYVTPADFRAAIEHQGPRVQLATLGAAPIVLRQRGDTILLGAGDQPARIVGQWVPVGNSIVYRIDRLLPARRSS